MAVEPARRHANYDDVLRAPEHVIAEVLNGDLVDAQLLESDE